MSYKIAIEYHDASPSHPLGPRMWDILESFREHYPDYKVTLFTVPSELRFGKAQTMRHDGFKPWVKIAKKAYDQGWVRYALHGFTHVPREFENLTYEDAAKRIQFGKEVFESCEIPLEPYFIAPNWFVSEAAEKAVEDAGFTVLKDRYYQWNLKDRLPQPAEFGDKIIIAHGHIQDGDGCDNGLFETRGRILELPTDTTFHFLGEAL
jgi:predicted deacetylase